MSAFEVKVKDQLVDLSDSRGLPVLGYQLIYWIRDTAVPFDELVIVMETVGLGAYVPARRPTGKATLKLAVRRWLEERGQRQRIDANVARRITIKTINSGSSEWLAYVLVAEDSDYAKLGISFGTELRVLLNKTNERIIVTRQGTGNEQDQLREEVQLTTEIMRAWEEVRGLVQALDIHYLVRDGIVKRAGGFSFHPDGGAYFLPIQQEALVTGLRGLFRYLRDRGNTTLRTIPVIDVELAREELAASAEADMLRDLEVVAGDLTEFEERPEKVRRSTVTAKLKQFEAMRKRIEAYAELTDMRQDRVTGTIAELEERIRRVGLARVDDDARATRAEDEPERIELDPALLAGARERAGRMGDDGVDLAGLVGAGRSARD